MRTGEGWQIAQREFAFHIYKHFPLKYDALYWGAIFPLGTHAVSTYQMGAALGIDFLDTIATVFLYLVLAAWAFTFAAWVVAVGRQVRRRSRP